MLNNDIICFIINFLNFKKMPKTKINNSMVRININDEIQSVLDELREYKFSFLKNAEIFKNVLAEYYANFKIEQELKNRQKWIDSLPERDATPAEEKAIAKAEKEYAAGNYITIPANNKKALKEFLEI